MKISLLGILKESDQTSINETGAKQFLAGFTGDAKAFKQAKPGLFAAFDDVLKFAKQDKNQIVGFTAKSPNKAVVISSVDDLLYALKTAGAMDDKVLALFNQGLLKSSKTPIDLIDGITREVVGSKTFVSRYGKLTDSEMRKALKAAGYSDTAVNSFMNNAKKNPAFKKAFQKGVAKRRKTSGGKNKNLNPKGNGQNVPAPQKKTLLEKSKELINNINVKKMTWKQLLAWGAGIGVGGLAIWWFLFDNDNLVIPDDTPETEPTDIGGEWLECIKEIVKSKEGVVTSTSDGTPAVVVKNDEYPQGLVFFTNGRVFDNAGKKKGSWKCKGGVTTIAEQESDGAMAQDVDTMIDYLDFPVTYSDLKNAGTLLKKYADNGKGKQFLNLYQQSGLGGGDLAKSLKYVITTEPESVQAKANLATIYNNIISGKVSTTSGSTPGAKVGLSNIEITWDGAKQDGGGGGGKITPTPTPKKSSFKDCNGQKLPHEFGCRSEQIKKLQGCLGIEPQLGNFGPKTKKALEGLGIDVAGGITQEIIDKVCGGGRKRERIEPVTIPTRKIDTTLKTPDIKLTGPKITSIYEKGKKLYDDLTGSGILYKELGRFKYKGDYLSQTDLDELNRYLSALGWKFMKEKDKEDYDVKYVWVKA